MEGVNVQAWMTKADRDRLARLAAESDRTLSAEVRRALVKHIEERSADKPLRHREASPR